MTVGRDEEKAWIRAVKQRDGWRCQSCGADRWLHAHHIVSRTAVPSLRNEVSNGITLCRRCHGKWHGADSREAQLLAAADIHEQEVGRFLESARIRDPQAYARLADLTPVGGDRALDSAVELRGDFPDPNPRRESGNEFAPTPPTVPQRAAGAPFPPWVAELEARAQEVLQRRRLRHTQVLRRSRGSAASALCWSADAGSVSTGPAS